MSLETLMNEPTLAAEGESTGESEEEFSNVTNVTCARVGARVTALCVSCALYEMCGNKLSNQDVSEDEAVAPVGQAVEGPNITTGDTSAPVMTDDTPPVDDSSSRRIDANRSAPVVKLATESRPAMNNLVESAPISYLSELFDDSQPVVIARSLDSKPQFVTPTVDADDVVDEADREEVMGRSIPTLADTYRDSEYNLGIINESIGDTNKVALDSADQESHTTLPDGGVFVVDETNEGGAEVISNVGMDHQVDEPYVGTERRHPVSTHETVMGEADERIMQLETIENEMIDGGDTGEPAESYDEFEAISGIEEVRDAHEPTSFSIDEQVDNDTEVVKCEMLPDEGEQTTELKLNTGHFESGVKADELQEYHDRTDGIDVYSFQNPIFTEREPEVPAFDTKYDSAVYVDVPEYDPEDQEFRIDKEVKLHGSDDGALRVSSNLAKTAITLTTLITIKDETIELTPQLDDRDVELGPPIDLNDRRDFETDANTSLYACVAQDDDSRRRFAALILSLMVSIIYPSSHKTQTM